MFPVMVMMYCITSWEYNKDIDYANKIGFMEM